MTEVANVREAFIPPKRATSAYTAVTTKCSHATSNSQMRPRQLKLGKFHRRNNADPRQWDDSSRLVR